MIKKLLIITLCIMFSVTTVFADGVNEINYIVTEHYSDDMYDDIEQTLPVSTSAGVNITSPSVILMEEETGAVLYEKNSNEKRSPASITKIMSLILICEAIDAKKLNLKDEVICTEHAASMGGSQIWLEFNEKMTVDDLLKAAVVGSANDATCALAEEIAGSEDAFVVLMNNKAEKLGMKNTNFKNCTGLDEEGHYTTANDIAIMSAELLKHDLIKNYTTIWMDSLRNGKTQLVNTNKMVRFYNGATGLKTGTTDKAGCCVSASAERDGLKLIAVVLGAGNSKDRFADAKTLLNYGFANYNKEKVEIKLPSSYIPVEGGDKKYCKITAPKTIDILINGSNENIEVEYKIDDKLEAPVKKNDTVGYITVYYNGNELKKAKITAKNDVNGMSYSTAVKWLLGGLIAK